jgi:hypothetical protein
MERKRQADQEAYYEDAPADVKQSGAESYAITRPPPPPGRPSGLRAFCRNRLSAAPLCGRARRLTALPRRVPVRAVYTPQEQAEQPKMRAPKRKPTDGPRPPAPGGRPRAARQRTHRAIGSAAAVL